MRIGILAVQGNYEAHGEVLARLGVLYSYVTHPKHLQGLQGLILPGGESTTMLKFLAEDNFLESIREFAKNGHGIFGTCAGAILMAKEVTNPEQQSLDVLDITIQRNAYGRQLDSRIAQGSYLSESKPLEMVFIRAPKIIRMASDIKVLATYEADPVAVMKDRVLLTTFHPELTTANTLHELFIKQCT